MKRLIVLSLVVLTAYSCLFAQTSKNPFSKYGYKKQVMYTSSKGEFEEFHTNADVVEIGSVYFNTKTNKVIAYVNEEIEVASATSAMSVDPLCEKYYWISPYAYCFNNPVRFIDPDGRAPGDFFKSKNTAATDWGNYYNGSSIIKGKELGSSIYETTKDGMKGYTYTKATEGDNDGTKTSPAPAGKKAVADIHSHGKYENGYDNDNFSNGDKWDNYNKKIDGYLATPSGTLQKYDVNSAKTTVISTQLPSDPNDPERKNEIKPIDKTIPAAQKSDDKKNN